MIYLLLVIKFKSTLILEFGSRSDSKLRLSLGVGLELERILNKLWLELVLELVLVVVTNRSRINIKRIVRFSFKFSF